MKFNEHLARLAPMTARAEKPSKTSLSELIDPKFITIHGRGVGVLDGVAAELFLQGLASTRLLVALNDMLLEAGQAMHRGDMALFTEFVTDLHNVLDATGAHVKQSYDAIEAAQNNHEMTRLQNPRAKS